MYKIDYSIYLVTDRNLIKDKTLTEAVEEAIKGGATIVQLREKEATSREFYEVALKVKEITKKYNVPLIINDRIDIALLVDADGLHIGQKDIPLIEARKIIGKNKIIGLSVSNLEEAVQGEKEGADYLGVGAVFSTSTKKDAEDCNLKKLIQIKQKTNIPIVAIGGINKSNVGSVSKTGIEGAAMISAILQSKNIIEETKEIKNIWLKNRMEDK